uniref:Uncharacterized protein n=1 Tax=Anguilla anguilla TaxID=7936 RepID=A0A0E9XYI3_ANGAN
MYECISVHHHAKTCCSIACLIQCF